MITTKSTVLQLNILICLVLGISGCARYQVKPLSLTDSVQRFNSRALNDTQIQQRLERLHLLGSVNNNRWDRAQLLVAASELNPKLMVYMAKLQVADAAKKTASALPNPTLNLGSDYSLSQTNESPWLWSVSTDWLLDAGLRRQLRMQSADISVQSARLDYAEALWTLRADLRAALLSYLVSVQRGQVLNGMQTYQMQWLEMQRQRIAQGEGMASDLVQVELELARTHSALAELGHVTMQAQARIGDALGVPVMALQSQSFVWEDLLQVTILNDEQLRQLSDKAFLSRGDLERAVFEYQRCELTLQQAVRDQYPQFSIGPGYSWDHGVKKISVGLSLGLPVFNQNQGPIAEAQAAREVAGQQALLIQSQILNEIDVSRRVYHSSVEMVEAVTEQHDAAEKLLRQVQQAMSVGAAERIEVIVAQLNLSTQKLAVLDAVERMQQSLGELENTLRTPLTGPEVELSKQSLLYVSRAH